MEKEKIMQDISEIRTMLQHLGASKGKETSRPLIPVGKTGVPSSTFGTISYPILLQYDLKISSDYYFTPSIQYSLFKRSSSEKSAEITTWHLILPIGKNFGSSDFDWLIGIGILSRSIKGKGGQTILNNGSGLATFSLPRTARTSLLMTLALGINYSLGTSRIGLNLFTEGLLSSKRTFDLMMSYSYSFSTGF